MLESLIQVSALAGGCSLSIPKEMEPQLSHEMSLDSLRSSVPTRSCSCSQLKHKASSGQLF